MPSLAFTFVRFGSKNKECPHKPNIIFGERVPGDLQTHVEVVKKDKQFWRKTTVEVKYPSHGLKNDCDITMIMVENLFKECKCHNEDVNLIEGGVGEKHMKINITSEANCPSEHKISCFTKCYA